MSKTDVTTIPQALLLTAVAVFTFGTVPSRAEENRLLPFWGQPFPSGYTRNEVDDPRPMRSCPGAPRWRYRGLHGRPALRCPVVLHARG